MTSIVADIPLPPRRPLHTQFVRLLLLPLVLAFVLAAAGTVLIGYGFERSAQETQRRQTMDIYAKSLSKPLWDCDSATARGIVDTLTYMTLVSGVTLLDICANETTTSGTVGTKWAEHSDRLQRPIIYHDEQGQDYTVGNLLVQFHPTSIVSAAMNILWRYAAIFIVMLAVMLAGAALAFYKIVGLPLSRFRRTIDGHATNGEAAMGSTLPRHKPNDELGDVMRAYSGLIDELSRRFTRQETLAQCASSLLATSANGSSQLADLLGSILRTVAADRIYLEEINHGDAANMHVMRAAPPGQADSHRPRYPRWLALLGARERVVEAIIDLPADERDDLREHGICSVAAFPVWGQSHWYGFICVQDLRQERTWSDSEQIFLQTTADMIGAFLEGEKHKLELATVINRLRDNEKTLLQMARHDPLTGLGNRIVVEEKIALAILHAKREKRHGYVLLIDLDSFKPINDNHGHAAGDLVLQEVGRRLLATVRRTDTVARIGGDEFVVIIESSERDVDLQVLSNKLMAAVAAPITYDGHALTVGSSIGIARYPDDGVTSVALLAHADQAMYTIKDAHHKARA